VESWKDSYFEFLAELNGREALALKRLNFPPVLYRYRGLERLAYTLDELRNGYLFLKNPAEFNDPYDSALSTSYAEVQRQAAEKILPEYGLDPNTISEFLKSLGEKEREEWLILEQQGMRA
jgi:hypothetical protein